MYFATESEGIQTVPQELKIFNYVNPRAWAKTVTSMVDFGKTSDNSDTVTV